MGEIREYRCRCGYRKEIFSGGGLLGCNVNHIGKFFPEEIKMFQKEREAGRIRSYMMVNELFSCGACKEVVAVPVFSYTGKDGNTRYFSGACPDCGGFAVQVEDEEAAPCPKCGQEMSGMYVGDWD